MNLRSFIIFAAGLLCWFVFDLNGGGRPLPRWADRLLLAVLVLAGVAAIVAALLTGRREKRNFVFFRFPC